MAKAAAGRPAERGISYWMQRVIAEREKARADFNADAVHDLRVAIRRCRSMAEAFQSINGDPAWAKMRKAGKAVFSALGELRDTQVLLEWAGYLQSDCPAVAQRLQSHCLQREAELKTSAAEAVDKFDAARWLQWAQKLGALATPLTSATDVFGVLALERFQAAHQLHARALRNRSRVALHELRIGFKHLRYIVENFLPQQDLAWGKDLRRIQDLLGEVHDLDVLWITSRQIQAFASPQERQQWYAAVSRERAQRVQSYREKMVGRDSLWQIWRSALPAGEALRQAVIKRFELWAASLDPDPLHTQMVTRFSLQLWDALQDVRQDALQDVLQPAALQSARAFPGRSAHSVSPRDLLHVAALTHAAGHDARDKSPHKSGARLLRKLEVPPGWSQTDIFIAALVARYHRGALPASQPAAHPAAQLVALPASKQPASTQPDSNQPASKLQRHASLSPQDQHLVDCLAGILRFADSLDGQHDHAIQSIAITQSGGRTDIFAKGYIARSPQAEKIAAARHLLESTFNTAILVHEASGHQA
jgi:CHAD domain-containing protein